MKKTIFLFSLVAGLFVANAQTSATLNVILKPVQSIVVNTSPVDLVYDGLTDYTGGVELEMADHLQVYSSGGFEVLVKVPLDNIGNTITAGSGLGKTIAANGITVTASNGTSTNAGTFSSNGAVALDDQNQALFSSDQGGTANKYTVTYKGAGANAYVGKHYDGNTGFTKYTTLVQYSIIAQ